MGRAPERIGAGRIAAKAVARAAFAAAVPSSTKPAKPLNAKAYGSIGHLPSSRLGSGDWSVTEGMARIATERPRKGDRVIVTEKLDGACMSVANVEGRLVALSRAGFAAADALYPHLRAFAPFVEKRTSRFEWLKQGERIVGEWLALAHGTMYDVTHPAWAPFIAFDVFRDGQRVLRDEFAQRTLAAGQPTAHLVHDDADAIPIEAVVEALGPFGRHGAMETVEGAVWRVEREGRVDFLTKWVRPDKLDGKYLTGTANSRVGEPVWLWKDAD